MAGVFTSKPESTCTNRSNYPQIVGGTTTSIAPPIVNALDANNILPLEPTWSKNEIAQKFKIILEVVEQRYLVAWDHVSNGQIQKLQADYQTWYQSQLRSEKSLYRTYCQWQELLTQQHPQGWSSWIILGLKEHPFLVRELKRGESLTPETELLLAELFVVQSLC